ncbi:hypothetical protein [Gryllotalpicola protaetiae]|uniref:Uncharacterized protein n=1 Tax=Gryllotalpicola protaetiae TaxID=2419771 RepID=A0A387BL17_9MICO|nr:hypothetical protein [Gryllotalpicola protaetiae]AYG03348.1 hypothetical protein D7I44_07265 [Gryllotalpicola protaetiae]
MTDAARETAAPLPAVLRHPLSNVKAVREVWTPFMGEDLANRFANGQLYWVLSVNFIVWGFVGGAAVALIGGIVRGISTGPVFGITLGIVVIIVGLMLSVIAGNSQRRIVWMYLPYVRELRSTMRVGRLLALLRQGSPELQELFRLHPEVFPKPR